MFEEFEYAAALEIAYKRIRRAGNRTARESLVALLPKETGLMESPIQNWRGENLAKFLREMDDKRRWYWDPLLGHYRV